MLMQRIQDMLKQAMGLDTGSIGMSAVESAVMARCRVRGLERPDDYLELVGGSAEELQQLVETVAVPETWFFRDPKAFEAMAAYAMDEWLPRHRTGTLRLLSVPSSTGEEPYSMAMALIDAGFPADRFRIDGVDISERVLELARHAVYGRNAFRGRNLDYRDRHFAASGNRHQPAVRVRRNVRFMRGNLLDPAFGPDAAPYDIIFCRNLLIYFDPDDQVRAVAVLRRMLADKGMLFIGHSESGLLLDRGFVSARIALAFAFRKADPAQAALVPPERIARQAARPAVVAVTRSPHRRQNGRVAAGSPAPRAAPLPDLETIQRIADDGRLDEAGSACAAHIRHHGPSVDALYLMGVIRDLAGEAEQADACYRKVLYLEPGHRGALTHLALLLERRGDRSGADVLNERSRRLLGAGGS